MKRVPIREVRRLWGERKLFFAICRFVCKVWVFEKTRGRFVGWSDGDRGAGVSMGYVEWCPNWWHPVAEGLRGRLILPSEWKRGGETRWKRALEDQNFCGAVVGEHSAVGPLSAFKA